MSEARKIEVFYLPETGKAKIAVTYEGGSVSFTISPEKWNKLVVDTTIMMSEASKSE